MGMNMINDLRDSEREFREVISPDDIREICDKNNLYYDRYRWLDDLRWCPSQCYYVFEYNGQLWCIYLRWRHADPWEAYLVPLDRSGNFEYYDNDGNDLWIPIPTEKSYGSTELDELKGYCLDYISEHRYDIFEKFC